MHNIKIPALWLALIALCYTLSVSATEISFESHLQERIEATQQGVLLTVNNQALQAQDAVIQYYTDHLFNPVWLKNGQLSTQALQLVEILAHADEQGLNPDHYHYAAIAQYIALLKHTLNPIDRIQKMVDLDLLFSDAFLTYSSHLLQGQINPQALKAKWEVPPRQTVDINQALTLAMTQTNIVPVLDDLIPKHTGYRLLLKALADYRRIQSQGGWQPVTEGRKLTQGNISDRVVQLRKRLAITGDLKPEDSTDNRHFDKPLLQAVKAFQRRHGLSVDGVVGRATLQALNIPVENRIEQLRVNIERWRWLPTDLGARYIMVNIAGFELFFVDQGQTVLQMPVVVGKTYRETPVFSGSMTYLVINPSWLVPYSIASKDKLPLIRKDPFYLQNRNMKLYLGRGADAREIDPLSVNWDKVRSNRFPYRIIQGPGPQNALGKIKFMFPNKHNVYLHDTSEPWLFNKTERSFSSGCIRVSDPNALADRILENNTRLDTAAIAEIFKQDEKKTLTLQNPIPVHILYWTAWVDESGIINFRKDIYGHDQELMKILRNKLLKPKTPHSFSDNHTAAAQTH